MVDGSKGVDFVGVHPSLEVIDGGANALEVSGVAF